MLLQAKPYTVLCPSHQDTHYSEVDPHGHQLPGSHHHHPTRTCTGGPGGPLGNSGLVTRTSSSNKGDPNYTPGQGVRRGYGRATPDSEDVDEFAEPAALLLGFKRASCEGGSNGDTGHDADEEDDEDGNGEWEGGSHGSRGDGAGAMTRSGRHVGSKVNYAKMARGVPLPAARPVQVGGSCRKQGGGHGGSSRSAAAAWGGQGGSVSGAGGGRVSTSGTGAASGGNGPHNATERIYAQAMSMNHADADGAAGAAESLGDEALMEGVIGPDGSLWLGGTTGQPGRAGRCAVCVIQRKGKCGTESAPKKCLRRTLMTKKLPQQQQQGQQAAQGQTPPPAPQSQQHQRPQDEQGQTPPVQQQEQQQAQLQEEEQQVAEPQQSQSDPQQQQQQQLGADGTPGEPAAKKQRL